MKIALIGYGYWGPNLAKNLKEIKEIEFAGICDTNGKRLDRAKSIYGNELIYTSDYNTILKDNTIDAVVIATPTEASYRIAIDALQSLKHVFMEKPISTTVQRARDIQEAADKHGLIVHCDHIMLYHPVIRYIRQMIEEQVLGELLYIDVTRGNLGPLRKDVNALLDLAVHDIAVIDFLSNGQKSRYISTFGQTCFGKQETLTYLTVQYESFIAHIKSSWVSPVKERKTVIAGTKKMVVFDDMSMDKLTIYDRGFELQMQEEYGSYEYHARTGDICIPHIPQEDALKNSLRHFIHCVSNKEESLSGPTSSIRVMKILVEAMRQLSDKRQVV